MSEKALAWIVGDDTGSSSKCLWAVMMGQTPDRWKSHPHDGGDLGRCMRLLLLVPEWKGRIGEMADVSPYWAALVARWDALEKAMAEDAGPAFDRNKPLHRTYKLMKEILDPIERQDSHVIRMGPGVSIRF